MSSSNVFGDSQWTDQLNDIRKFVEAQQGPPNPYLLSYDIPADDPVSISDDAQVNNNQQSAGDSVNLSDDIVVTSQDAGTFLIDTAKIGFSDIG